MPKRTVQAVYQGVDSQQKKQKKLKTKVPTVAEGTRSESNGNDEEWELAEEIAQRIYVKFYQHVGKPKKVKRISPKKAGKVVTFEADSNTGMQAERAFERFFGGASDKIKKPAPQESASKRNRSPQNEAASTADTPNGIKDAQRTADEGRLKLSCTLKRFFQLRRRSQFTRALVKTLSNDRIFSTETKKTQEISTSCEDSSTNTQSSVTTAVQAATEMEITPADSNLPSELTGTNVPPVSVKTTISWAPSVEKILFERRLSKAQRHSSLSQACVRQIAATVDEAQSSKKGVRDAQPQRVKLCARVHPSQTSNAISPSLKMATGAKRQPPRVAPIQPKVEMAAPSEFAKSVLPTRMDPRRSFTSIRKTQTPQPMDSVRAPPDPTLVLVPPSPTGEVEPNNVDAATATNPISPDVQKVKHVDASSRSTHLSGTCAATAIELSPSIQPVDASRRQPVAVQHSKGSSVARSTHFVETNALPANLCPTNAMPAYLMLPPVHVGYATQPARRPDPYIPRYPFRSWETGCITPTGPSFAAPRAVDNVPPRAPSIASHRARLSRDAKCAMAAIHSVAGRVSHWAKTGTTTGPCRQSASQDEIPTSADQPTVVPPVGRTTTTMAAEQVGCAVDLNLEMLRDSQRRSKESREAFLLHCRAAARPTK